MITGARAHALAPLVLGAAACGGATIEADGGARPEEVDARAVDAYGAAIEADAPVAYWRFDEATGTIAANAVSGAPGGLYRGGVALGEPGVSGTAARLDGAGCIAVGDHFQFAGTATFTVEAWVKLDAYGADGTRLVSTEGFPTGTRSGWNLSAAYPGTGYPYFDAWNSDGAPNQYTMGAYAAVSPEHGELTLDAWHHVVGTYTDTQEQLWVDGVLRDQQNQSALPLPQLQGTLSLGCAGNETGGVYLGVDGVLDEVALYDHVLPPARIAAHLAAGRP